MASSHQNVIIASLAFVIASAAKQSEDGKLAKTKLSYKHAKLLSSSVIALSTDASLNILQLRASIKKPSIKV